MRELTDRDIDKKYQPVIAVALLNLTYAGGVTPVYASIILANEERIIADYQRFLADEEEEDD